MIITSHPLAKWIKLAADGYDIQIRYGNAWVTRTLPALINLGNVLDGNLRVKPPLITYRVALMKDGSLNMAQSNDRAEQLAESRHFSQWISDWATLESPIPVVYK